MPRSPVLAVLALALVPALPASAPAAEFERRVPSKSERTEKSTIRTRIPERKADAKPAPAVPPDDVTSLEQRVAALEAQLEALQEVIRIQGHDVVIEAPKDLTLQAGMRLKTRAGSHAIHESQGTLELKGALAKLPEESLLGGKRAVRQDATVSGVCPAQGGALQAGKILP